MTIDDKTELVLRPHHAQAEQGVVTMLLIHTKVEDTTPVDADGKPAQHAWMITPEQLAAALNGYAVGLPHAQRDPGIVKPTASAVKQVMRGDN